MDQLTFSAPAITVSNYPSAGLAPLIVYFTSPGTDSVTNTVVNRLWNFGVGFTSNAQNPAHTYTTPGQYQPTLVAYSANDSKPLVVSGLGTINVGTDLPGALASFQFDNFSDTKSLQLNGSATNVTTSDGAVLELTPANYNQAGSAFIANPVAFGPDLVKHLFHVPHAQLRRHPAPSRRHHIYHSKRHGHSSGRIWRPTRLRRHTQKLLCEFRYV